MKQLYLYCVYFIVSKFCVPQISFHTLARELHL